MVKINNLRDEISRQIMGEVHDLVSLPGYWFKPRKYSTEGAEKIQNLREELRKVIKGSPTLKYIKKLHKKGIENPTPEDIINNLSDREIEEFYDSMGDLGKRRTAESNRLVLLYGIGEHNFKDDGGNICKIDEDFVDVLCESQDLVLEMIGPIMEHNRPLARRTSGKSETSQNGS